MGKFYASILQLTIDQVDMEAMVDEAMMEQRLTVAIL